MRPAMGLLLHSLLLLAPAALQLSYSQVQLEGLVGESVYFPALRLVARDIVRILWFSGKQGTHIAEAKPQFQEFNTYYLPYFSNRLAIHAGNLSLEMRELRLEDQGPYRAVVDIASDPANPRTFSYQLSVRGRHQDERTTGPPSGGQEERTTGPPGGGQEKRTTGPPGGGEHTTTAELPGRGDPVTTEGSGEKTTKAEGDGGTQDGGESQGSASCRCALMGYLTVAVYVPLSIMVAIVHMKTRN